METENRGTAENLKEIIQRQREVLSALEAEQQAIENSDLAIENAGLKAALEKSRQDREQVHLQATGLAEENANLKQALYEQIYNEKTRIIDTTKQKLDVYFQSKIDGEINRLTALENSVKSRIDKIRETLTQNHIAAEDELYANLDELTDMLDRKVTEARANTVLPAGAFSQEEYETLEALKKEQITDEQIRAIAKKNNLERFVGLNVLNTVGVFLLIVGAITLARFTYVQLTDLLKGIMLFALGGLLLAVGEVLSRKAANVFSLGLSAGGIGILYAALATSYFGLHILDMYPAILVCALITAGAFVLSSRYRSQTIAAFALIGGYLPMFSIGADAIVTYGAMLYFIALHLLALLISLSRKWRISSFIGLFLNIISSFAICISFYGEEDLFRRIVVILYIIFAFFVYTAIPVISTYRSKSTFRKSDIVLLAINTVFSSLIMYGAFFLFHLEDYHGLLAVAFAAVYLFLGRVIEKLFAGEEGSTRALFYLTGLAFVILIIPLQFGRAWLSLGWLAEGVLLAVYGVLHNEKVFRQAGFSISLLCLGAFLLFDCTWMSHYMFVYKYSAITLGSVVLLGAYMYKKRMSGQFVKIYKYAAMVNVWLYTMYLILSKLRQTFYVLFGWQTTVHMAYLLSAAAIGATFFFAYTFSRIRLLSDSGTKLLSLVLYGTGILAQLFLNAVMTPVDAGYLRADTPAWGITVLGTAVLFLLGILSVFALRDLVKMIVTERKLGVEWYPIIISGYFVVLLTQNLIAQYHLSFSNAAISILYVLIALAWIIYGFTRRYSFIRKFGLGLAILSVIKLFIIDLAGLTQGFQILSYFALGITLIAISFVYQYFNKRLELREEASADGKKDS